MYNKLLKMATEFRIWLLGDVDEPDEYGFSYDTKSGIWRKEYEYGVGRVWKKYPDKFISEFTYDNGATPNSEFETWEEAACDCNEQAYLQKLVKLAG